MRWLVLLVPLVVVVAAVDIAVAEVAEHRTAEQVSRALDAEADVDFRGFPIGLRLLTGSVQGADMTATDVPLDNGGTIDRLDVTLTDVTVRLADLGGTADRLPPARKGTFTAEVGEASVEQVIGVPALQVDLRDGVVHLGVGGLGIEADAVAREGGVAILPRSSLTALLDADALTVDFRDQPGGPEVSEVEVRDGVLVLRGTLTDVEGDGG